MKTHILKKISRLLTLTVIFCMLIVAIVPVVSIAASELNSTRSTSASVVTTPGSTGNYRYFKEDTYYQMTNKINAPMTIEFELTGCSYLAGAENAGVIVGNYSEDASTYINIEATTYGKLVVRGKLNGTAWQADFYQSEADIRMGGIHHYTITIGSGWTGVSLYVDGNHKATRYPASLTIPKASDFTHPFRIGGDYREGHTNYFKALINSVAMYSDIRTADEIKSDVSLNKTWSAANSLVAAYDLTKMGEAALRDYSDSGNKLLYVNGSGIQVENFGKYEIEGKLEANIETFESWIYMPKSYSTSIGGTIFGNYRSYNGARIFYEIYKNGNPRFSYTNSEGKNVYHRFTDVDLRTGEWQHLAIVHDTASGEARCYVNCELKQTVIGTVAEYSDDVLNQNFLIGRDTTLRYAEGDGEYWENRNDHYFKGFIKEVRIYSDVRSSEEIASDYSGSLDVADGSLLACYQLAPENAYNDIQDLSDNGYTAKYKQLLWEKEYIEPIDNNYAYTFAVVGDTQTVNDQNPELLKNIYQYILDNKDAMNIQYVIGLGDITEVGVDVGHKNYDETKSHKQWADAKEAITMMDGILPYTLIRGDGHDGIELFNQYFAKHEGYTNNISGYMQEGRIDNVYHTFKVGDVDYMILCLDHGTKDGAIAWANEVVAAHPNHRVIVTTHHYMQSDGTLSESSETGNATAYDPDNNAADVLWSEFLSKHPNISMVMCGHSDSDDVLVTKKTGDHGNEVTQILINPQGMDAEYYHGSKGMVAMLHFSADGESVQVEYYSTIKGTYRPTSTFTVSYDGDHIPAEAVRENEKAPDCTNSGSYDSVINCTACGKELDRETVSVEALGHKYGSVVTDPTCTEEGYTTHTCSVCNHSYVDSKVNALGHTAGDEVVEKNVDPDCENKGSYDKVTYCSVCGAEVSRETVSVEALGHKYGSVVTDPTCTEEGYTTHTCSVCNHSYVDSKVNALGHEWMDATVHAPKTCTACGLTEGDKLPDSTPDDEPTHAPAEKDHSACEPENEIMRILNIIINFFRKLFGLTEKCYCGDEL